MRRALIAAVGLVAVMSAAQQARAGTPTVYNTRSAFERAAPGLALEDFGASRAAYALACNAPLNEVYLGPCFSTLKHGPTYDVGPGNVCHARDPNNSCLVVFAPETWGNASPFVASNYFADTFQINFAPPGVEAVGFNVHDLDGCGGAGEDVTITARGQGGVIVSQRVPADGIGTTYWGVVSQEPITSVNLSDTGTCWFFQLGAEGVSNLEFGTPLIVTAHSFLPALGLSATVTDLFGSPVSALSVVFHQDATGDATSATDGSGTASCCTVTGAVGIVRGGGSYTACAGASGYPYSKTCETGGLI